MNDKEIKNFEIKYCCPQCKRQIDNIKFDKDI